VRDYLSLNRPVKLSRIVVLTALNKGSKIVDAVLDLFIFDQINGFAFQQLGTGKESLPLYLPAKDY
jgi:hypothetical protein